MAANTKVKESSPTLPGASPRTGLGEVQLGQSGLKRSYGYIYEELLPQLQGRKAINVYQEMSQNSSVIGGMLFAIDMFMRKVAWRVEAASDSDEDKQKAKFLESCKDDMEHTWADFIAEVNTMLVFGWSWFEIVYKQRFNDVTDEFGTSQSQFNDGYIGWKKLMPCSQESWWRWDFDPASGKTIGMWQRPAPDYSERYLPIGKSLHFRTTSRKDNPEGASILRTAYRAWYFLKRIEEIEAIGVERDLAGIPIAKVPAEMLGENASDDDKKMVASIIKLVQNVRRDEQEGIVWPQAYDEAGHELYEFGLLTSGGTRQFPTDTIINRYETRIAMTALADFLLLGNDASSGGSYALATSKSSMFQSALETWLNTIENTINDRAVPLLFRQNGINSGPYPKFRHDIVQKPTLTDLSTLISAMAGAGAQLFPDTDLENHLRGFAELPIREPNDSDRTTEDKIISQQLGTLLASSEAEEALAERSAKDANAEGIVPMAQGSVVARMDPVTLAPPAGGAPGAPGQPAAASQSSQATGVGGKKKNSKAGAPTKSTGPVKSKLPPSNRRTTISTRAAQGAPTKTTGGAKTRSVAKAKTYRIKVKKKSSMAKVGGVAVKAADTGRVLMLQRGLDHNDPASGKWEFPGGHRESLRESPESAGMREWQEETGMKLPRGKFTGHWSSRNGVYHGIVLTIPHESAIPITGDRDQVVNPDDPDGDKVESLAWWNPKHLKDHPALRKELRESLKDVHRAIKSEDELPLRKSTDVSMVPYKNLDSTDLSNKKCDYCQRKPTNAFVQKSDGGVLARSCQIHTPQARAEVRWSQNNQVSPNNPMPYEPFPRVLTQ